MKQITLLLLLATALSSCLTTKNVGSKFAKLKSKCDSSHKAEVKAIPANFCHQWYPVTESKTTKIKYLPGKPIPVPGETQYVTVNCDTAYEAAMKEAALHGGKPAPATVKVRVPVYIQVDTADRETTIVKKDSAELKGLRFANEHLKEIILDKDTKIDKLEQKEKELTKDRDKWRSRAVWPWVIIGAELLALLIWLIIYILRVVGRIGFFKK